MVGHAGDCCRSINRAANVPGGTGSLSASRSLDRKRLAERAGVGAGEVRTGGMQSVPAFTYTATTTFELLSGGGTLILDESGLVCAPGNSGSAPPQSHGFPEYARSSWTVDPLSNGQFSGLTGSGTDASPVRGQIPELTGVVLMPFSVQVAGP